MPDNPEPVGQDDFDQHVTPIVPDGTGVGRATQGSLPPVEWEPVGQDAPDVGWGRVFGHNRREFTGRPGTRRCETGHREADGCITFCVLEHGHDTREGHIYELHFAHAPDPNSTQAEVRRLREIHAGLRRLLDDDSIPLSEAVAEWRDAAPGKET